jgi:glutaredoxin
MFRFYCWSVFLFLPTLTFAQVEPGNTPAQQSELVKTTPAQATRNKPALVETTSSQIEPLIVQPVTPKPAASSVQASPAKPTFLKPAAPQQPALVEKSTTQIVPAKPATVQTGIQKPATSTSQPAPVKPIVQKPAPVLSFKPASAPAHLQPKIPVQIKPASGPIAPTPTQTLQTKPSTPLPTKNDSTIAQTPHAIDIEVFIREECPQCDKAKEFLTKLQNLRPQLKIIIRDVRKEPAALELLKRVTQNQGDVALDYPAFVVGGQLIIGFTEEASTAQHILDNLTLSAQTAQQPGKGTSNCESVTDLSCGLIPPAPIVKTENINFNLFGYNIPLLQIGLPLFTIVMGMLDGFNHSATWVLILILSLVVPLKKRSAIFAIAGTYIATQGIIYFIFLSLWLRLFTWTGTAPIFEIIFSVIALVAGSIYFKNYMFFGQHISITSPEITKPGIYTKIRKILQSENLTTALLGTIAVAILVQFSEITYKSLFPALYTRVLTLQNLDSFNNYAYLVLYNFAYMMDDIIILMIAMVTLKQERTQAGEDRMLKLTSGLAMYSIAAFLLIKQYR